MAYLSVIVQAGSTIRTECRLDRTMAADRLAQKLEQVTGIPGYAQVVKIERAQGGQDALWDGSVSTLGSMDVLHVDSTNPTCRPDRFLAGSVEKYEMTDDDYEQRSDTVLAYKRRNKIGRFAEGGGQGHEDQELSVHGPTNGDAIHLRVGQRCIVQGDSVKLATIRYTGPVDFHKDSHAWCGIEYDERVGKNDGLVQGRRYFNAKESHGAFVHRSRLRTLDDDNDDDDLEMEEI